MRYIVLLLLALTMTVSVGAQDFAIQVERLLSQEELTVDERLMRVDSLFNARGKDYASYIETFEGPVARFVEQHADHPRNTAHRIRTLRHMALLYSLVDSLDAFVRTSDEALRLASRWEDCVETGDLYVVLADHALRRGDQRLAQEYYFRAIDILGAIGSWGADRTVSRCYYQIATNYLNTGDMEAIRGVLNDMKRLCDKYGGDRAVINYDYNSVLSAYYATLCAEEPQRYRDSMIAADKRALSNYYRLYESGATRLKIQDVVPAWNYYNIALAYDIFSETPLIDSIKYYIDKAAEAQKLTEAKDMQLEVEISLSDMRAWILLYEKDYRRAERQMLHTISLIDSAEMITPNSVVRERSEALLFLVDLYEQEGRYAEALEAHRLYNDNQQRLFDIEKSQALHEIETRHQVERKEAAIASLREQNRISRQRVWYTASIAGVLFVALVMLVVVFRLHRINSERQLYEKALENEIARESAEEQLHQSASQSLIDKLKITIANSGLAEELRRQYIANLDSIEFGRVSALYGSASESLTQMDRRYILCFLADISIPDLATIFNVETASIYTVRYRLKKKFPKSVVLPF